MSASHALLALVCVVVISIGQVLFKRVGLAWDAAGTWLDAAVLLYAACAFALYAGATLLWIYLLRSVELSRAYPFMAISFVVVPLFSAWFFGEQLSGVYLAGVLLIAAGVIVVNLAV